MNPQQFQSDKARRLAERQAAAMNPTTLYNTDLKVWQKAARYYRARPDAGPTFRVLEGNVWGIPKTGWVARFESTEEAERVILAAGFRFVPEEKGFRVSWNDGELHVAVRAGRRLTGHVQPDCSRRKIPGTTLAV